MAKQPGKMALYEAIRKSQKKLTKSDTASVDIKPKKKKYVNKSLRKGLKYDSVSNWPENAVKAEGESRLKSSLKFLKKSWLFWILAATVILLGMKLGQIYQRKGLENLEKGGQVQHDNDTKLPSGMDDETVERKDDIADSQGETVDSSEGLLAPAGDNVIVIITYANQEHLKPVEQHFLGYGIETEIVKKGKYYFLITKERYDNPNRKDSDGYQALQRIKEVGLKYKAPKGYETFGSRPFQDAYGMKIRD